MLNLSWPCPVHSKVHFGLNMRWPNLAGYGGREGTKDFFLSQKIENFTEGSFLHTVQTRPWSCKNISEKLKDRCDATMSRREMILWYPSLSLSLGKVAGSTHHPPCKKLTELHLTISDRSLGCLLHESLDSSARGRELHSDAHNSWCSRWLPFPWRCHKILISTEIGSTLWLGAYN